MFLSREQLDYLVGDSRPFMQRRWLRERRWIFEENARGEPVVLASYAEQRLGTSNQVPRARTKVNLEHV